MAVRVLLIDRSALMRSALRRLLEDELDIVVVAEASNGADAVTSLARHGVDVVIVTTTVDREALRLATIAALQLAADVRIVCVSHWADAREVDAVLTAGVLGCVEACDASDQDLRHAVRLAGRGERYLSPGLPEGAAAEPGATANSRRLTPREREILVLIAQSKSNREIAHQLNLSMNTIAVHRTKMMKKIGVRKATALALFAAERGLLARR
jgi:DNA-binding NarL/FixJ family response regulator